MHDIIEVLESRNITRLRKATKGKRFSEDELSALYSAAVKEGKLNAISHVQDLGVPQASLKAHAPTLASTKGLDALVLSYAQGMDDINAPWSPSGRTLYSFGITHLKTKTLEALVGLGAQINAPDARGYTPLDHALMSGKKTRARWVIQAHDSQGTCQRMLELCQDGAASAFVGIAGMDAFVVAYAEGMEDINAPLTPTGHNVFSLALAQMNDQTLEVLVRLGARMDLPDHQGRLPIERLLAGQNADSVHRLISLHRRFINLHEDVVLAPHTLSMGFDEKMNRQLHQSYTRQTSRHMTRDEFIEKWGPIECLKDYHGVFLDPLGESFFNGKMWSVGYFPHDVDPRSMELRWNEIDHARTLSQQLCDVLDEHGCVQGCSGDAAGCGPELFFIPGVSMHPSAREFDLSVSDEALEASRGYYPNEIVHSLNFFESMVEPDADEASQVKGFTKARALANTHLTLACTFRLYPDFSEFPFIAGGVDWYSSFVGVLYMSTWT